MTPAAVSARGYRMSALVRLEDVGKRYVDAIALHPTSLSIESGKTTVLIGPSGCGKSTLLRLIIRLLEPDTGSIEFKGKPVTSDNIDALRRRIGYVIQEGGLFPHLTARANVLLMARYIGNSEEETQGRLLELSKLTRFSESLLGRYPVELSGGQRQRVSLMRALMLSPELLLLDEPLGALDALTRIEMHRLIEGLWRSSGFTALLVTHDVQEAVALADRVILIEDGQIALDQRIELPRPRSHGDAAFAAIEKRILDRVLQKPDGEPAHEVPWPGVPALGLRWAV